jgi:hypothetical protein
MTQYRVEVIMKCIVEVEAETDTEACNKASTELLASITYESYVQKTSADEIEE